MGYTGKEAAKFKIAFINRFNEMESFIKSLYIARLEHSERTGAILEAYGEPWTYRFSNEANMINRIVLEMDAKTFRDEYGIKKLQVFGHT